MHLKKSLIIALIISIISLTAWELYWRTKPDYYKAYLEDSKYLWSEQRAMVDTATSDDIILLGASRSGYNLNTHIWKETQGLMPINLSVNGQNPGSFFDDIVNNTSFNGTIIISVTPVAWFWPKSSWHKGKQWINHYYNQTYAHKLGHFLSKPLQRNLVMLTKTASYNDLDLKSLINQIELEERVSTNNVGGIKLISFGYNDEQRNLYMYPRMTSALHFQKEITNEWDRILINVPDYEDIKDSIPSTINTYKILIDKFKSRGGNIVFIRHKSEEGWNKYAQKVFPDDKVWNKFIETVKCPSYHYEDYKFMSKYKLPDWSHMNAEDAKTYTNDMVKQLIKDKHIKN